MKPSQALDQYRDQIRAIALGHRVSSVRVFGSVLRGDDTEDSDLDLLVQPTVDTTLFDIAAIRLEVRELTGVEVDVLTPKALPEHFRAKIMAEAIPV